MIQHFILMDIMQKKIAQTGDVLIGHYDFQDSEMLKLSVKQSNLPHSGMGLFAAKGFTQYEFIAEYYGSIMRTINSNDDQFALEDKMVQIDQQCCVISRGPASRANDIVKWEPENYNSSLFKILRQKKMFPTQGNFKHNAKISINSKQKAFLKATQPIKEGEQIFIDYGFDYWDFFYRSHINGLIKQDSLSKHEDIISKPEQL